jgi:hypothetical protein
LIGVSGHMLDGDLLLPTAKMIGSLLDQPNPP